ncbi:hypothetical protein AAOGI_34560 [Agarivorans albus]
MAAFAFLSPTTLLHVPLGALRLKKTNRQPKALVLGLLLIKIKLYGCPNIFYMIIREEKPMIINRFIFLALTVYFLVTTTKGASQGSRDFFTQNEPRQKIFVSDTERCSYGNSFNIAITKDEFIDKTESFEQLWHLYNNSIVIFCGESELNSIYESFDNSFTSSVTNLILSNSMLSVKNPGSNKEATFDTKYGKQLTNLKINQIINKAEEALKTCEKKPSPKCIERHSFSETRDILEAVKKNKISPSNLIYEGNNLLSYGPFINNTLLETKIERGLVIYFSEIDYELSFKGFANLMSLYKASLSIDKESLHLLSMEVTRNLTEKVIDVLSKGGDLTSPKDKEMKAILSTAFRMKSSLLNSMSFSYNPHVFLDTLTLNENALSLIGSNEIGRIADKELQEMTIRFIAGEIELSRFSNCLSNSSDFSLEKCRFSSSVYDYATAYVNLSLNGHIDKSSKNIKDYFNSYLSSGTGLVYFHRTDSHQKEGGGFRFNIPLYTRVVLDNRIPSWVNEGFLESSSSLIENDCREFRTASFEVQIKNNEICSSVFIENSPSN